MRLEDTMSDDLMDPNASEAVIGTADADAPQDPVQAARDEAWLAQFRADNAAKVVEYDARSVVDTQAEQAAQEGRRDYDLKMAESFTKDAAVDRAEADALEKKAQLEAARHDEYEAKAETDRHMAAAAEGSAAHLRSDAKEADASVKRLDTELSEQYKVFNEDTREYEIMQEQAVAAQRIATDEARLPHPGDAPPAEPGGEPPKP